MAIENKEEDLGAEIHSSAQHATQNTGHVSPWQTNRGIGVAIFIITAILAVNAWFSDWAHETTRDGFILGWFPLFAIFIMSLCSVWMIFDNRAHEATEEIRHFKAEHLYTLLAAVFLVSLSFMAIGWIGFVPAIFALVFIGTLGLGFRPLWVAALVALFTSIGLRFILLALTVSVTDDPLWRALF